MGMRRAFLLPSANAAVFAGVRGVFIKSTGKVFSAGADLTWMKRTAQYTRDQNLADAVRVRQAVAC